VFRQASIETLGVQTQPGPLVLSGAVVFRIGCLLGLFVVVVVEVFGIRVGDILAELIDPVGASGCVRRRGYVGVGCAGPNVP
jgi:hypothetical protein